MKKEYTKPYLAIESFQLDASLAGACIVKLSFSVANCTLTDAEGINYLDINFGPACSSQGGVDMTQENPRICYHAMARSDPYMES